MTYQPINQLLFTIYQLGLKPIYLPFIIKSVVLLGLNTHLSDFIIHEQIYSSPFIHHSMNIHHDYSLTIHRLSSPFTLW